MERCRSTSIKRTDHGVGMAKLQQSQQEADNNAKLQCPVETRTSRIQSADHFRNELWGAHSILEKEEGQRGHEEEERLLHSQKVKMMKTRRRRMKNMMRKRKWRALSRRKVQSLGGEDEEEIAADKDKTEESETDGGGGERDG